MKKLARLDKAKQKRDGLQSSIRDSLVKQNETRNHEVSVFEMDQDAHRFMWTAVCLQKGIDFEQMDALRSVVNGTSKFSILGGAHMKSKFVELVLDWERNNVRNEVKGKLFSWFHDSGTRGKSCLVMVVRFISRSSETGLL
jgi:hypothetical protein